MIADMVTGGGFPPLLIDPVDFVSLYRQNMAKVQPAAGAPAQA
jgi:preprotein translocase subunit SecB